VKLIALLALQCYVYRLMVEWANLVAPVSEIREEQKQGEAA
jgi:hypothetical protein